MVQKEVAITHGLNLPFRGSSNCSQQRIYRLEFLGLSLGLGSSLCLNLDVGLKT